MLLIKKPFKLGKWNKQRLSWAGFTRTVENTCAVQKVVKLDMRSLAYVEHSSGIAGSELYVAGQLQLRQQSVFRGETHRSNYRDSILFNRTAPYQLVRMTCHLVYSCMRFKRADPALCAMPL